MFGLGDSEDIKGVNPWRDWKKKKKEKPLLQRLKEWYRDYCQDHHWDRSAQLEEILDEEGDSYVKPSVKLFLYNAYRKFRGWTPIFRIRMLVQKLFRANHISDNQLWDLQYPLSKHTLKYLKAFKASERHGYPGCFSEYNENEWKSREEYDEAIAEGRMLGGGNDAWEKTLDHIIMALEFVVNEGDSNKEAAWYVKYFGFTPYEDLECNKHTSYEYRDINAPKTIGCAMSSQMPDLDKVEWCTKSVTNLNMELINYAETCVHWGLMKLGDFWRSFWD